MFYFARRRLELITASAFLFIGCLISVAGWLAYRSLEAYHDAQRRATVISEQLRALNLTLSTLQDAETGQRGFLLTRDAAYLEPYSRAVSTASGTFAWLQSSFTDEPRFAGAMQRLESLAADKFAELDETIRVATEQGVTAALRIVRSNSGKNSMDQFRSVVSRIQVLKRKELAALQAASSERVGEGKRATIAFGVAIGTFLIAAYWYMIYDLNDRRRLRSAGGAQGSRDSLTGMHNASYLARALKTGVKHAARDGNQLAFLMIEVDAPGLAPQAREREALIVAAARELAGAVHKPHTLARLGDGKFGLLVHSFRDLEHIAELASRIADRMTLELSRSLPRHRIGLGIGIAIFPDDAREPAGLMAQAEYAMRVAAARRRARYQFASLGRTPPPAREEMLAHGLTEAVDTNRLTLAFQPQVIAATGEIVGAEALVRWVHPELGVVSPDEFIPVAERTGLILPVGHWVLERACHEAAQWQGGRSPVRLAVNISALELGAPAFCSDVSAILKDSGLDPALLEIELTERVMMEEGMTDVLARLRALGVKLAIDDFGTGYSSLSYLSRFPADVLKIDRSFIRSAPQSPRDSSVVRTIINIGHELGITIVAEGIETCEQAAFLAQHGCDVGQGYLFHRPMPGEDFRRLLAGRSATPA